MRLAKFVALFSFLVIPALAQLAPPNDAGVRMGHIHLAVKDVDAQKHFWTDMMGGTIVKNGPIELIQFPGIYIMLRKAEPTGPPEGTPVNHFGFVLKDVQPAIAKWKAAGLKWSQAENPDAGYVWGPDEVRVEVFGNPQLTVPIQMDHVHFYHPPAQIDEVKAWYVKNFGAAPGQRRCVSCVKNVRIMETGNFPGSINFSFAPGKADLVGTKGRAIDHIGFEVNNLDEFVKKLEAQGIKMDIAPRTVPNSKTKIAFLTDPWGTYIELTEGLGPS